ncbi:GNAT family N-acetyltransferase [Rhizobium sp.]
MSAAHSDKISEPTLLDAEHDATDFDCGKPALNIWLQRYANGNQRRGFTRVIVVTAGAQIVGFYGLSPTGVDASLFPRRIRSGQPPKLIPAILLGQLAVDIRFAGKGIGSSLLRNAFKRAVEAARLIGGPVIIVEAIDENAKAYWVSNGFEPMLDNPSKLFRPVADIESQLAKLP